jgi:glucuronate isomerase
MERGELPNDIELIGSLIRNVCFENARQFFGLEMPGIRVPSTKDTRP